MSEKLKKIDRNLRHLLQQKAEQSERKRSHYNLHSLLSDPVNRLCITLTKGTYIRPHRHSEGHKWELIIALSGEISVLIYDDDAVVTDRFTLSQNEVQVFEMPPNTWHSLYSISEHSSFFEVKPGPFLPTKSEDFALWVPEEKSAEAQAFLSWCSKARLKSCYRDLNIIGT